MNCTLNSEVSAKRVCVRSFCFVVHFTFIFFPQIYTFWPKLQIFYSQFLSHLTRIVYKFSHRHTKSNILRMQGQCRIYDLQRHFAQ